MLHAAFLAICAGCLTAGWWQIHRAMQGNSLSYLYSIEWPAFVVVAAIGWWQMVHDTPEDIEARKAHHALMRAASTEVVARTLPRSALSITVGSSEVAHRPIDRTGMGSIEAPRATAGVPAGEPAAPSRSLVAAGPDVPADAGDEYRAILLEAAGQDDGPSDAMTEYNRYLALLAVKGRAKTWRNPRGL